MFTVIMLLICSIHSIWTSRLWVLRFVPGSSSATIFSTLSVAEMIIARQKIHSLDRILSRGQTLEIPYLGRDGRKTSRGGRKTSRGGQKIVAALEKLVAMVKKSVAAVKNLGAAVKKLVAVIKKLVLGLCLSVNFSIDCFEIGTSLSLCKCYQFVFFCLETCLSLCKCYQFVSFCLETCLSLCKCYQFVSFCLDTCCRDLAISNVRYDLK